MAFKAGNIFILVLLFTLNCLDAKLMHLHILFRHGDRSPVSIFPTNNHNQSDWPIGLGQLTKIGMQQHFRLGSFFKQRYHNFISENYDATEIYVRSTDVDRTLMSASSHLSGFYYPNDIKERWNASIPWIPIPVHTIPSQEDILLVDTPCPRYDEVEEEVLNSDVVKEVENANADLFNLLDRKTGIPNVHINNLWSIYDNLYCQKQHNLSLPDWVTPDVMDRMRQLNDFGWFLLFYNPELCRLRAGVLLETMFEHMQSISLNKSISQGKNIIIYSGHDTDIAALLSSLNVFNLHQPPYASSVLIELHYESTLPIDRQWFVRLYYHNSSVDDSQSYEPVPLILPGCQFNCSLNDFASLTQSERLNPDDYAKACQSTNYRRQYEFYSMQWIVYSRMTPWFFVIFIFIVAALWCVPRHRFGRRTERFLIYIPKEKDVDVHYQQEDEKKEKDNQVKVKINDDFS